MVSYHALYVSVDVLVVEACHVFAHRDGEKKEEEEGGIFFNLLRRGTLGSQGSSKKLN